jgi:hypothetical protein
MRDRACMAFAVPIDVREAARRCRAAARVAFRIAGRAAHTNAEGTQNGCGDPVCEPGAAGCSLHTNADGTQNVCAP